MGSPAPPPHFGGSPINGSTPAAAGVAMPTGPTVTVAAFEVSQAASEVRLEPAPAGICEAELNIAAATAADPSAASPITDAAVPTAT
eukprot:5977297-Prymnesium_polylepis.1